MLLLHPNLSALDKKVVRPIYLDIRGVLEGAKAERGL